MGSSQRRVISEITKVWENAVAKGKLVKPEERLSDLTSWIREHPTLSSIQNKVTENVNKLNKFDVRSTDIVTESTRHRVSRLMSAYEELIGISEVKGAHARVLTVSFWLYYQANLCYFTGFFIVHEFCSNNLILDGSEIY